MRNYTQPHDTDFSFLDSGDFKQKYASGPKSDRMRFYIQGIRCSKCVREIEQLPVRVPGLLRVQIEMGKNLAHVEVDPARIGFADVAESIKALGFTPIPLTEETGYDTLERQADRAELLRLGIAGFLAGNIMTFSFATYLGAAGEWATIFGWLSLALYLPVVTYVALPFYRGAWQSLQRRRMSIDLPMAVASFAGFVFSTVELLRGKADFYFDSLAGFLFLILISRWVQSRMQRRYLRPEELVEGLQLQRVRRIESPGWMWRPLEKLQPGDRFLIQAPETLPADSELLSNKAHFSLAWLSGESKSKTFLRGSLVPAGARLISGDAQLIARRTLLETGFGKILREVQGFSLSQNRTVLASDRWAQWLLGTVFIVALVFLAVYWSISPEQAIQRALALIILACPCAMAFGTPLALASSLRKAQRRGLILRDAGIFEAVNQVKRIYFDKTGTLTETELTLRPGREPIPAVYQKIVLSLENESLHPIAFAFRTAFSAPDTLPPVDGLRETAGVGVSGFIFGRFYELKADVELAADLTTCTLYEDDKVVFTFEFETRLKADARETLGILRSRGYELRLVSGDAEQVVQVLAEKLGFLPGEIRGGITPIEKAQLVREVPNAMMVGDGINDSLALMRAQVGVAVTGGMEAALKSAGVYLSEPGLKGLIHLFDISAQAHGAIRQNLSLSLVYNLIGAILALMGYVNPLIAALAMPVSSGLLLAITWLRGRS